MCPACGQWLSAMIPTLCIYCTISIDSAWGVTCDQMDEISTTSNAGVTWDTVENSADHERLKGKQVKHGVVMLEQKAW